MPPKPVQVSLNSKRKKPKAKNAPGVPDDLHVALATNKSAGATFAGLSSSHKREYVKWISEAKRPQTRNKRIAETLKRLNGQKKRG